MSVVGGLGGVPAASVKAGVDLSSEECFDLDTGNVLSLRMWFQEMELSRDFAWKRLSVLSGFQKELEKAGYLSHVVNVPHSSALDEDMEALLALF